MADVDFSKIWDAMKVSDKEQFLFLLRVNKGLAEVPYSELEGNGEEGKKVKEFLGKIFAESEKRFKELEDGINEKKI